METMQRQMESLMDLGKESKKEGTLGSLIMWRQLHL